MIWGCYPIMQNEMDQSTDSEIEPGIVYRYVANLGRYVPPQRETALRP